MEIIINLIASVIFAILGAVSYRYAYLPCKRRMNVLSRLSPLDFSKHPVYLCYGLISPGEASKHYTVEQGDLSAITLSYQVLVENYRGERIRLQNCMITEPYLNEVANLLSISGPRWNSITERYMKRLGSPLQVADDRRGVILRESNGSAELFPNTYRSSGDPDICYGIILGGVLMSGGDRAQNVLICAGSNSLSTYGCVIALDHLRYGGPFRRMGQLAELRKSSPWGLIVKVQNLSTASGAVRGQLPFERGQLEVRIERSLVAAKFFEPGAG